MPGGEKLATLQNVGWAFRLKKLLQSSDRNVEAMARDAGIGRSTLNGYMNNDGVMHAYRLRELVPAAGCIKTELAEYLINAREAGLVVCEAPGEREPATDLGAAADVIAEAGRTVADLANAMRDGHIDEDERAGLRPEIDELMRRLQALRLQIGEDA